MCAVVFIIQILKYYCNKDGCVVKCYRFLFLLKTINGSEVKANMKLEFKIIVHVTCLVILILFTYPNNGCINFMLSDFLFSWITVVDYWGTSNAIGWIFGQNQVLFCGVQHIHPFCKSTKLSCFRNPSSCCTKALWCKYLEYWNGKEKSVFEKAD